jgi:hypothetical protein
MGIAALRITGPGRRTNLLALGTDGRIDMQRLVLAGVIVGSARRPVDMCGSGVGHAGARGVDLGRRLALFRSALNVGQDYIGSLVNTLSLAHFGGAMPLIPLLSLGYQPLSVASTANRSWSRCHRAVGDVGLVLCVRSRPRSRCSSSCAV